MFGSKLPEPIGRRGNGEGACQNRGTGCGGKDPKWKPVVVCEREMVSR